MSVSAISKNLNIQTEKNTSKPILSTKSMVAVAVIPTLIGVDLARKSYHENKGKSFVYSKLMERYAAGSTEHSHFKDCLELTKSAMKSSKKFGAVVAITGLAACIFAVVYKKIIQNSSKSQFICTDTKDKNPEIKLYS